MKFFSPLLAEKFESFKLDWYLVSEKFDGYRALYYNGVFRTRKGNIINVPEWFVKDLPKDVLLDGELYSTSENFNGISSTLRKKVPIDREWRRIVYVVFDIPKLVQPFTERYRTLKRILECNTKYTKTMFDTKYFHVKLVVQFKITDKKRLEKLMGVILSKMGEGLMLRDPESYYENKRSDTLLKYKNFLDAEAKVDSFELGDGKNHGRMGKLCVTFIDSGVSFKVGSGFTDNERMNFKELFPMGTIVKVKYLEMVGSSKPRSSVYLSTVPEILLN